MNKADLINKISEILGVDKPKNELAFEIFLEKISERLQFEEALRIPGIGIFQLKEEPFTGVKKTFPGLESESKTELMFAPFVKNSESLYLTFDVQTKKRNPQEFNDDIFSISVEKPIVPINENLNYSLSANSSYILLRKSIGELIEKLLDKSDHLENFDIWEDFINSGENSEYEVFEEITLDEKFSETESLPQTKEQEISVESDSFKEKFSELDDLDSLEEFIPEKNNEPNSENEPLVAEEDMVLENEKISEESSFEAIGADADEFLENFDLTEKDLLTEDLVEENIEEDQSNLETVKTTDNDLELNNSEIEQLNELIEESEPAAEKSANELNEDDFDLSADELNEILENEENSGDDWDWGDELKQEIVDRDEDEIEEDSDTDDKLEENSSDLFDQLEESLKDELDDSRNNQEIEENLLKLEEELSEENDSKEEIKTEDGSLQELSESETKKEDKLDSLLQKKDIKLSFMAKIKQKLGIFFWILVAVFAISTAGGIYYFIFMTQKAVDLNDPVLDEYGISVVDSTKQDSVKNKDTVKAENKDSVRVKKTKNTDTKAIGKEDNKKQEHKKNNIKKDTLPGNKNTHTVSTKKNVEQKQGKEHKKKTVAVKSGKLKYIENPVETKIGKSHIYKSGNKYSVQVSSWKKKSQAEKEAQRLIKKGHSVYIVKVYLKSLRGTWYRVRVGDFYSLQEAKKFEKLN